MKAIDTDILSEIMAGNPAYAERIGNIPLEEQVVPLITVEEVLRGRLNTIRQAEAHKARITIELAYLLFEQTLEYFRPLRILPFTKEAAELFAHWKHEKVRGSTHDLRIAASCVASSTTLVTRNRRDFEKIPGLMVEFWV